MSLQPAGYPFYPGIKEVTRIIMNQEKLCYMQDKSCGGCCYDDISEVDREGLVDIFRYRRQYFKAFLNGRHDVAGYESEISKREKIATIETDGVSVACAYLGFLNDQESHVGCLAHPEMNGGMDLRDHGFYKSAKLCENFFCGAAELYQSLTPQEKELFNILISHWTWYELSNRASVLGLIRGFVKCKERVISRLKNEEFQSKNMIEIKGLIERTLEELRSSEKDLKAHADLSEIQRSHCRKQEQSTKSGLRFFTVKPFKGLIAVFWKGFKEAFFIRYRSR